jgi:hypothetical protein
MFGAIWYECVVSNFVPFDFEFSQTEKSVVAGQNKDQFARVSGLQGEGDRLLIGVFQLNEDLLRNVVLSRKKMKIQ